MKYAVLMGCFTLYGNQTGPFRKAFRGICFLIKITACLYRRGGKIIFYINTQAGWPSCRDETYFEKLPYMARTMLQLFYGMPKLQNCPGKRNEISHIT